MFDLPEDLRTLSVAELSALLATLRDQYRTALGASDLTDEGLQTLEAAYAAARGSVLREVTRQNRLTALESETDPAPEPPAEDPPAEDPTEPPADPPPATDPPAEEPEATPAAGAAPRPVVTTTGLETRPATGPARRSTEARIFRAHAGVAGKRQGDTFEDWADVASSVLDTANDTRGSGRKHVIGSAAGHFEPHMVLGESMHDNLRLFEQDEIMAALCAPPTVNYALSCMNTDRRPVRASLPVYQAPRGAVTVMSSPTLEDITAGTGIWNKDDDANPNATKAACQTIKCNTPSTFYIYAVYRCMVVKEMLARTYPELVDAWLNRLAARQARLAEVQMLEAMATGTTTIEAHTLGYNATVSITTNLLNYLALYQELQRWDVPGMEAWIPRWARYAIKADMMRRRRTDGGRFSVPSDAEVDALFTDVGVTPHWFIDTPSWATPVPKLQVSGRLGQFTRNLEVLVAPRGKFAAMDKGELNFGVNNVMRDNTSLQKNEFTLFFENWEGIVNTTSCPAHILEWNNICWNGQQIADLVINCEGYDEVGAAS